MIEEFDGIKPVKVILLEACNTALSLMRSETIDQLSYLLGRFDAYLMLGKAFQILNADEIEDLREQLEAVPAERLARGLD